MEIYYGKKNILKVPTTTNEFATRGLKIGPDQIEALYDNAKFQFVCGCYSDVVAYLNQYRVLTTNSERTARALWGASEILNQNWDAALEELNRLKEIIDSKKSSPPLNQLQDRIWLMHWSLFIFFHHENGRNGIIDLFFQDRYLNAIQTNAHHLMRYLAVAVVVNKRRRNMLKELIKVIQHEQYCYKDLIAQFLECLYVKYDFDGAQQKLMVCEQVILNDPFLGKCNEGNSITVPFWDEFFENARLFIFETYCHTHRCIDISKQHSCEKLNMRCDETELWIMNKVRSSKLDANIDLSGTLNMTDNCVNVHDQIIESLKNLNVRTCMLAQNIVKPAQATLHAARVD